LSKAGLIAETRKKLLFSEGTIHIGIGLSMYEDSLNKHKKY
jgi:hypothetical protein